MIACQLLLPNYLFPYLSFGQLLTRQFLGRSVFPREFWFQRGAGSEGLGSNSATWSTGPSRPGWSSGLGGWGGAQILGVRVPLESELFRRGVSAQGLPCQWLTS